tara:strand:+ start:1459 stop:1725 length:267 start_codon:yes stop_codon:yes gene_type:complete
MIPSNIIILRKIIKNSGLQQKQIAKIIDVNVIHFNKVLNGKVDFTKKLANKLSKISLLHTNEHDLLYPHCKTVEKTTFEQYFLDVLHK